MVTIFVVGTQKIDFFFLNQKFLEFFDFIPNPPDMCAEKFPLVSMGGRAEGLTCADPGARTPISSSGNFLIMFLPMWVVFTGN